MPSLAALSIVLWSTVLVVVALAATAFDSCRSFVSRMMTGTLLGGMMPTSVMRAVTNSAGVRSYIKPNELGSQYLRDRDMCGESHEDETTMCQDATIASNLQTRGTTMLLAVLFRLQDITHSKGMYVLHTGTRRGFITMAARLVSLSSMLSSRSNTS